MLFQVAVIHSCSFFEVTGGVLILHLIQNLPRTGSGPREPERPGTHDSEGSGRILSFFNFFFEGEWRRFSVTPILG